MNIVCNSKSTAFAGRLTNTKRIKKSLTIVFFDVVCIIALLSR